jgi:hypothetical protein
MIDPFTGYGLQNKKANGDHPKGNQSKCGTGNDGEGRGFTLEGLRVQIDVSECMVVHGAILYGYGLRCDAAQLHLIIVLTHWVN